MTEPTMYFKSSSQTFIIHSSSRVYVLGFALLVKEKEQKMDVCGSKKEMDGLGGQRTSWEGVMCRATH